MAADEKDRFGEKMRDVEAAREDIWAHKHDEELIARMRTKLHETTCPHCGGKLKPRQEHGIHMMSCPHEHPAGAWIEAAELRKLFEAHRK
jgi:ribosomal protein L37AE/L43A